jgi:hypothetical protein
VRSRFLPPTSLSNLKMFLKKNGIKFRWRLQNLYESIPRRTVAVLKARDDPTP